MGIKRYISNADTTITNAYKFNLSDNAKEANMGESDIMELFTIYAQASSSSLEKSRMLLKFSVDDIKADRDSGALPVSGSVSFYLRMFNAPHGQSIPEKYNISVLPVAQSWDEGYGLDMESYLDIGAASWLSASATKKAQVVEVSFLDNRKHKLVGKHVSLYNGLRQRKNYWFKVGSSGSAPVLTGTEFAVDISAGSATTAAHYATILKNAVNSASSSGHTAALSGSSTSVVSVTNDVLGEAKSPIISNGITSYCTALIQEYGLSAVVWNTEGGEYYTDLNTKYVTDADVSLIPIKKKYVDGPEDTDVEITSLVEEWIVSKTVSPMNFTKAYAQITFTGLPADDSSISLTDTVGRKRTFLFKDGSTTGNYDGVYVYVDTDATPATQATKFKEAVDSLDGFRDEMATSTTSAIVHLSQSNAGFGGNRKITTSGTTNSSISNSGYFANGVGLQNNGLLVKLSGSFEDGTMEKTFYTKKYFTRGSEFFFKRPMIEARWDSSLGDDRGDFYASSSLVSSVDNKHTLFLYNFFRGTPKNIPDMETGKIYVQLFDSSGTELVGATSPYPVTGGHYPGSTGMYTASFAIDTTESTVRDIWVGGGTSDGSVKRGVGETQYHTGSFQVNKYKASSTAANYDSDYVSKITNLKSVYSKEERPRFRLYSRKRDWQPNIYNVASNVAPTTIVKGSYYKIDRESDGLTVISYGTGSLEYTKMSYDMSGSYFDLDMSLLDPGYSYEISLVFKLDGVYKEQNEKYKFRVEK